MMIGQSKLQNRSDAIQGLEYTGNSFAYDSVTASDPDTTSDDDKALLAAVMSEKNPSTPETISLEAIRQIGENIASARSREMVE